MSKLTGRALAAAFLLATVPALATEPIVGRASVIDGDTLEIRGTRFRLHGVDAPESSQPCTDAKGKVWRCGAEAANRLSDRIGAANISCAEKDRDRYGRVVAVCTLKGEELNRWLVREGHALAYRQYGGKVYDEDERAAHSGLRGIWRGTFEAPWEWRRKKRAGEAVEEKEEPRRQQVVEKGRAGGDCQIKGNIGAGGEKIFHLPGSATYERTKIDEAKGERMFCSEAEAQKAGWRAAQ